MPDPLPRERQGNPDTGDRDSKESQPRAAEDQRRQQRRRRIGRALDSVFVPLRKANQFTVVTLLVAIVVLAFTAVVFRYVFNNAIVWGEELTRYLFIAMTFLGAAYVIPTSAHLRLDVVYNSFPPKAKLLVDALITLVAIGFLVMVLIAANESWNLIARQRWTSLRLSMRIAYAPIPIAAVLALAYIFEGLVRHLLGLERPTQEERTDAADHGTYV